MNAACLKIQEPCAILRGQDIAIRVSVVDQDTGDPVDLTAATVEGGLARRNREPYLIDGVGSVEDTNVAVLSFSGSDTETLPRGAYYFSVWVILSGEATPVAIGVLPVEDDPRANAP